MARGLVGVPGDVMPDLMGRGGAAPARLQGLSDHGHAQPGLWGQGQAVDPGRRRTAPQPEPGGHIRHSPQGVVPDAEESPDLTGQGSRLFGGVDALAAHAQVDWFQQPVIAELAQVPPCAVEVEAGPEALALLGPGVLVHGVGWRAPPVLRGVPAHPSGDSCRRPSRAAGSGRRRLSTRAPRGCGPRRDARVP